MEFFLMHIPSRHFYQNYRVTKWINAGYLETQLYWLDSSKLSHSYRKFLF
jgi:hypothetical protein